VRGVIEGFRKNNIPLSAIYLDIDYMDGYRVFTFNKAAFPDMKGLADFMAEYGTHLITIIEPSVKFDPGYRIYDEGLKNDMFIKYPDGSIVYAPVWAGMSAFPDFSRSDVAIWWGRQYDQMIEAGVSGFWHDMNEPAVFTGWGENSMADSAVQSTGRHEDVHNLFGFYMAKAAFEHLSKGKRPFILSRSGWAGISRYAWVWTGDAETSWKELKQNMITMINLSLSGVVYVGCDIGGFTGSPTGELFIRWLQLGFFFPLFRVHSSKNTKRREPWEFGKYSDIAGDTIRLRHRLLPYIYTIAHASHEYGIPMVKPVFWNDERNERLYAVDDEFLFGDSILAAPVVNEGRTFRSVIFPAGRWYDFYSDGVFEGQAEIEAGIEKVPFFIAEGSIIPTEEGKKIVINIYFSQRGMKGQLYSDGDGDENMIDIFSVSAEGNMNWTREGKYEGVYGEYNFRFHGISVVSVSIDGKSAVISDNAFSSDKKFENANIEFKI
ncbi:MAG: glycoside hydrolase family 31 protein, partial [Thermoplasmata archaeon]